jgi:DNA-directed RNA polymerase specialized sigma24 family protein
MLSRVKIADYFRARRKRAEWEPDGGDETELAQIADREPEMTDFDPRTEEGRLRILDAAIALVRAIVRPRAWQAFREVELAGRNVAEVASELGMTAHAVSAAVYRVHHFVIHTAKELSAATDAPA